MASFREVSAKPHSRHVSVVLEKAALGELAEGHPERNPRVRPGPRREPRASPRLPSSFTVLWWRANPVGSSCRALA